MTLDQKRALLYAAQRGDEAAWHAIVTELGPKLRGYARAKGVAEADDLMQDVLLAASKAISGFEGSWESFTSWLFTIAYRRIADSHRKAYRTPQLVSIEAAVGTADAGGGPDSVVIAGDELGQVVGALEKLSPVERDVVLLRIVADLSSEEVGTILGKRPGTIRVIQSRAIDKIKQTVRET